MLSNNLKQTRFGLYSVARTFSSTPDYDVAIIGGGPGGYVAAIKAAQLGLKTVCVEKRGTLGGTCLNVGCIPSKALLNASHKYHEAGHDFAKLGIKVEGLSYDFDAIMGKKTEVVSGFCKGIEALFKKNKVDYIKGHAAFVSDKEMSVKLSEGGQKPLKAKNYIIATGSEVAEVRGGALPIDENIIVSSTGALSLKKVPKKMVVVGAGVIGLELGSVYSRLGTEVTVVQFLDHITPSLDREVAKKFQQTLEKQGIKFILSSKVSAAKVRADGATVTIEDANGGNAREMDTDVVLVAVGRRPNTDGLDLAKAGVETDKMGRIVVDLHDLTVPGKKNIRAIGDVIEGPMLAHKAEEEGVAAVEMIATGFGHVNYDAIPGVIYTHPEVANVGKSEEELKAAGVAYKKFTFPFMANSRAKANNDSEGFVKVLADKESDKLLGAWIIGPCAGELIHELTLAIEYGASAEDVARTCHAHPTLAEAIKEACIGVSGGKAIHI